MKKEELLSFLREFVQAVLAGIVVVLFEKLLFG